LIPAPLPRVIPQYYLPQARTVNASTRDHIPGGLIEVPRDPEAAFPATQDTRRPLEPHRRRALAWNQRRRYSRGMAARRKKQPVQGAVTGRLEKGQVRLLQPVLWDEGQQVVVIPLSSVEARPSPPAELLEEDAIEFARRPGTLVPLNRSELE